jgi:hypothetical protein
VTGRAEFERCAVRVTQIRSQEREFLTRILHKSPSESDDNLLLQIRLTFCSGAENEDLKLAWEQGNFTDKHIINIDTYIYTSNHSYKYTQSNSVITSEKLRRFDFEIHEVN